jgi:hypothetical protein
LELQTLLETVPYFCSLAGYLCKYVTDLEMTAAFMKLMLSKSEVGIILQVHKQMLQAPLCSYSISE